MQKMLAHRSRAAAIELLFHFGLLLAVFPELAQSLSDESTREKTLLRLKAIEQEDFIAAVAVLCYAFLESLSDSKYFEACKRVVKELKLRWRLSNEDAAAVEFTIHNAPIFLTADQVHWSVLQPLLISPFVKHSLQFVRSLDVNEKVKTAILLRCASALKLPNNELNPPFLVDGHMLMKAGLPTGPEYARLIKLARAAQLDGVIRTHDEALEWVRRHCRF